MNKALALVKDATLAEADLIRVLSDSLYPGAKPESIKMVLGYCRAAGLDPMMKPVHIVPMSVKKPGARDQYEWRDVIMPGISLYRAAAADSGVYVGKTEPEFGPVVTKKMGNVDVTYPEWCKISVTRLVAGREAVFTAKEYWIENYASKKDSPAPNSMWAKRPFGQIAKVAEAQALRQAFPDRLGGQSTAEEMEGKTIDTMVDVTPKAAALPAGKPTNARAQLDGFAGRGTQTQDDPGPEDDDAQTDETIDDPKMPEAAAEAFAANKKWMAAWKWLAQSIGEVQDQPSRQAMVTEYRDILLAVQGYNDSYAMAVDNLMNSAEVTLE